VSLRTTVVRIAAAGGAVAAAAIFAVTGADNASAAATHVGLVVKGQGSYCVAWHSGMTGIDVLSAAGLSVSVDQHQPYVGFVLAIGSDVEPNPGVTYWTYYQLAGTSWHYSDFGAASFTPSAGTVQGWAVSPTSGTRVAPPVVSYAALCGAQDAPAPPPAPPVTAAPPPVTTKAPVTSRAAGAIPASVPVTPATAGAPGAPATGISAGGVDPLTITSPDSATPPDQAASAGSVAASAAGPSPGVSLVAGTRQRSTSPVGFIVAGSIAVVLVGAGGFTAWRRRPSGAGSP
jgi:hypothetical protein